MNIIFVSNGLAKAKTLSMLQVSLIALALILLPVLLTLLLIVPQEAVVQKGVKSLTLPHLRFSFNNPQKHLDAYAVQLGEIQARMMRLDAQSDRLSKLAGEKPAMRTNAKVEDNKPSPKLTSNKTLSEGRGGPLVLNAPLSEMPDVVPPNITVLSTSMSEADLQKAIAELLVKIEFDTNRMGKIEAKLLQQGVLKDLLPNSSPIAVAFKSSSYGWRSDPFTGEKAFHEGLDFPADTGTPIYAAAGGIVTMAEDTSGYGKLVKVEHGAGLETRYAHNSKLLVKVGERVEKGQIVAEAGSTGRSTGPHLHYEIRLNGNALDPRQYLNASN